MTIILSIQKFTNCINFIKRRKWCATENQSLLLEMLEVILLNEKKTEKQLIQIIFF